LQPVRLFKLSAGYCCSEKFIEKVLINGNDIDCDHELPKSIDEKVFEITRLSTIAEQSSAGHIWWLLLSKSSIYVPANNTKAASW
jgi:hypothetical protein